MPLRTSNLRFAYRSDRSARDVLSGISVDIPPAALTAIIGPNGAGKSTLLRLLLGVLKTTGGEVLLDNQPIHLLHGYPRAARIAYLSQRTQLVEPLTAEQVVALGRYARPHDSGAARRALELVGAAALAPRFFGELSAGQQQRVALARVLAQLDGDNLNPPDQIILADEPVSAQDPRHIAGIMSLLHAQSRAPHARTVVVILHDLTLAARYADHVILLNSCGSLAAAGPAATVLQPDILSEVFEIPFHRLELRPGDPTSAAILAR